SAFDDQLNAPFAHHSLIQSLRTPDLSPTIRESLCEIAVRWLRANWKHIQFSRVLDELVGQFSLRTLERTELLELVAKKYSSMAPGVNATRRNRTMTLLLGQPKTIS